MKQFLTVLLVSLLTTAGLMAVYSNNSDAATGYMKGAFKQVSCFGPLDMTGHNIVHSPGYSLISSLAANAQPAIGYTPENIANKGAASGYASLDSSSYLVQSVPWANLLSVPSMVNTFNGRTGPVSPQSGDYTATLIGLGNVTDDAQLKRAAGDFASFGNKATPNSADLLLIEDSAASGVKKNITIGTLPNAPLTPPVTSSFSFIQTSLPSSANWISIAWNGTVYCAVAYNSSKAATSSDGITWTAQTLPSSAGWDSIAWNGTVFCAIATGGTVAATSPDGATWTAQTLPSSQSWNSIAWNGSVFCAVAQFTTSAATSPDGHTWTAQTMPSAAAWYSIACNGTVFCAVANGSTAAATSPDGHTWTSQTLPSSADWYAIASDGTKFCAVAFTSTIAATSPDGHTWTLQTLPVSANWQSIAWNGITFCAVGGSNVAATSPDGATWTQITLPVNSYANNYITSNGSTFCAVWEGTNFSAISTGQLLKNNAVGGFSGAVPGVDYQLPVSGCLIGTQYLTSGATFTPDAGTKQIGIKMVGGGGGGGYNLGSGGGAGGYLEKRITSFSGTASYSIGAAGTAGTSGATDGGNGGNTTFTYNSITYTAHGGTGGTHNSSNVTSGAGVSANGDLNIGGGDGEPGETPAGASLGAIGGASFLGGGAGKGNNAVVPGAGGGGGPATTSGGTGGAGLIIITEYN
jgi:hypothetical protein